MHPFPAWIITEWLLKSEERRSGGRARILIIAYLAAIVLWTGMVSVLEKVSTGSITSMILGAFFLATVFYLKSVTFFSLLILVLITNFSYSTFWGLHPFANLHKDATYLLLVLLAWVASRILYKSKVNSFIKEKELIRAREELEAHVADRSEYLTEANTRLQEEIRERRKTEEALRESETKYRQLFNFAPSGIYEIDFERYRIVSINDVACQYMGYTREEILAMNPDDFMTEKSREVFARRLVELAEGKNVPEQEVFEVVAKDGSIFHVQLTVSFHYENDQPVGAFVVAHDITEQKKALDALRESEEKYRLLVESTGDLVFMHDESGKVTYANHKGLMFTGYSFNDVVGRSILEFLPPEEHEAMADRRDKRMQGERKGYQYETTFINRDGVRIDVDVHSSPIYRHGGLMGVMVVARDISFRKQAEEQRRELENQLQQARKMEAIGTLTGGIAHDFNNLLQAINGYTQIMLLDKGEDDPDYSSLTEIESAGKRAAGLIRQLLLFSRKLETEKQPVDLNREVRQVAVILERTIPKMVDIELQLENDLWDIVADPIQVEQILLNLGVNAADAMPEGGELKISTENVMIDPEDVRAQYDATQERYVKLMVCDTGQGMDAETVEHIFEPFYTTKDIGKGTGLGLASAFGIIKSHGGFISCESEIGRGSAFNIFFPASNQTDLDYDYDLATKSLKAGSETILLVDDEEPIREFATRGLTRLGYTVRTASSGEEALKAYFSSPQSYEIVVMDLGMPGMGGARCLQEMVSFDPNAKVLIASGYSYDGKLKKILESGASGYVAKPYHLAELTERIRAVLDEKVDP